MGCWTGERLGLVQRTMYGRETDSGLDQVANHKRLRGGVVFIEAIPKR
jgi:hypothetical protein